MNPQKASPLIVLPIHRQVLCKRQQTSLASRFLACFTICCFWLAWVDVGSSAGQETPYVDWLTGNGLETKLTLSTSLIWRGNDLRERVRTYSASQRVCLVLDRRVDPGQPVNLRVPETPLAGALQQVASHLKLGTCRLGPVIVLTPRAAAEVWPTVAALARDHAKRVARKHPTAWSGNKSLHWEDLTAPRQILQELAERNGLSYTNLQLIPHDLWAGVDLPAMTLADRLSLIAGQFDLTFQVDSTGRKVTFVPFPEDPQLERFYPVGPRIAQRLRDIQAIAPQAQVSRAGRRYRVRGSWQDHQRIASLIRSPAGRSRVTETEKRWNLQVKNKPLGLVLKALCQQRGLTLLMDQQALATSGISLDELVSYQIENASSDELFRAVLMPVGLTHQLQGKTLRVKPAAQR